MSAIPWGKIVPAMFAMMALAYTAPAMLDGVRTARSQGAVAAAAPTLPPAPAEPRPVDYFPAQFPPPQGQPEEPVATF